MKLYKIVLWKPNSSMPEIKHSNFQVFGNIHNAIFPTASTLNKQNDPRLQTKVELAYDL